MNIILVVIVLYFLSILGNNILDNFIINKVVSYLNMYLYGEKIKLAGKEKEIIDALIGKYAKDLTEVKKIPFYSFICKVKAAREVYDSIDDLIDYLNKEYDFILIPNKKDSKIKDYIDDRFFVSYISDAKYHTIWFTYSNKEVKIVDGTETFKSLKLREQYEILLKILRDFKNKKTESYNFSQGLDEMFIAGIEPELEYFNGDFLRSRIVMRELKKDKQSLR